LKQVCGKLLGQQITEANIFYLLDLVDKFDCTQLAVQCGKYLACNFMTMWREHKEKMLSLSVDTWTGMFQSDDLLIPSEQELYEVMVEYASQFKEENKQIAIYERLLPYIRLSLLPMKFLIGVVEKNRVICKIPILPALLFETYRYKVTYSYLLLHLFEVKTIHCRPIHVLSQKCLTKQHTEPTVFRDLIQRTKVT
jgi:hypothetical protein